MASMVGGIMFIMLLYKPITCLDPNSTKQSNNVNGSTLQLPPLHDSHNVSSFPEFQQLFSSLSNGSLQLDMSTMFRQLMGSVGNGTSSVSLLATPFVEQILKSPQIAMLLASPIGQQLQKILTDGGPGKYLPSAMNGVSTECRNDVQILLGAIFQGKGWALKFLDAMGKPPSGISDGQLLWLGSYDQCVDAKALNNATMFRGQYCLADITMTGIVPSLPGLPAKITIGLCIPDSCQLQGLGLPVLCDIKENFVQDQSAIAITSAVSVIGIIILLGTMYDVIRQHLTKTPKKSQVTEMDFVASPLEMHKNGYTTSPTNLETTQDKPSSNKYDLKSGEREKEETETKCVLVYD
ncbi:hypothetical protein CHS0354_032683 [Potamilus streckersoni]|uniref:Nose resistant-to-fluoxetine protein N-terminal domain-containing protein n=1 Tax=Potamilus streckersoni TaxID=2493646 RepID=A0AAE0SID0_9BIVA|nr:hypothetical protein CHS0354_032683 [Potamilus streckersoni]